MPFTHTPLQDELAGCDNFNKAKYNFYFCVQLLFNGNKSLNDTDSNFHLDEVSLYWIRSQTNETRNVSEFLLYENKRYGEL